MICLLLVCIILITSCGTTNVGTALFHGRLPRAECWSQDDLARLKAREMFQDVIPLPVTPDKITSRYIKDTIRYYQRTLRTIELSSNYRSALLKEALADSIGGYLRSELLPTVRFAYYAGYVPYRHARELEDFFENLKTFLNTKGLGWREPRKLPQWTNLTVVKIFVGSGRELDPCAWLITKRDANACIHLPHPKMDDTRDPSAVALPFKTGGLVSLTSPRSENVLLKYYTMAHKCILRSSPKNCRHADFVNFNNELWQWLKRDIAPHLVDEKLYSAYGGVLRIAAAVQRYGRALSRRNIFENQNIGLSSWLPWKASRVYVDADWAPIYVGLILIGAFAICLLQICYYSFSEAKGCNCRRSKSSLTKEVYAKVDTNFPAILHHDVKRHKTKNGTPLTKSFASIKTRVYDLNENAERLMEVIMSDTETDSPSDKEGDSDGVINLKKRMRSPPQLQTPISQLRIERTQAGKSSPSNATYCRERDNESWSDTSSSDHSMSASSRTHSGQTRNSRDLWTRHLAHKAHINMRSTRGTV